MELIQLILPHIDQDLIQNIFIGFYSIYKLVKLSKKGK